MFSSKLTLGAVAALALAGSANALALELTVDTFDTEVSNSGKAAFVKFYAPWYVSNVRSSRGGKRVEGKRRPGRGAGVRRDVVWAMIATTLKREIWRIPNILFRRSRVEIAGNRDNSMEKERD